MDIPANKEFLLRLLKEPATQERLLDELMILHSIDNIKDLLTNPTFFYRENLFYPGQLVLISIYYLYNHDHINYNTQVLHGGQVLATVKKTLSLDKRLIVSYNTLRDGVAISVEEKIHAMYIKPLTFF